MKELQFRTTFGSSHVEKVQLWREAHFEVKSGNNTTCSERFGS